MVRNKTEHHATRRAWWLKEFEKETPGAWTSELESAVRIRVGELKRDADDELLAWELWQRFLGVLSEIEEHAATSGRASHVSPLPQRSLRWLRFFIAQYPPDDLRSGLRRDEDGEVVSGPVFPDVAPKEPARLNEKRTDPVSRTVLIHVMCGIHDKLAWILPNQDQKLSRTAAAKAAGAWTDRSVALTSLLLGNRADEPGTPKALLNSELQTTRTLHHRQLLPPDPADPTGRRVKKGAT